MSTEERYFKDPTFGRYYVQTHAAGVLDEKTKGLIHLAVTLALKCEPCVTGTIEELKAMGASDEEIKEAVEVAACVGAGAILAMADRSHANAEAGNHWWEATAAVPVA